MLHDARMSAMTGRAAAFRRHGQWRVRAGFSRANLSVSLNRTFAAQQKIGRLGSKRTCGGAAAGLQRNTSTVRCRMTGVSPKQKFDETFRLWKADLQRAKQNDCLAGQTGLMLMQRISSRRRKPRIQMLCGSAAQIPQTNLSPRQRPLSQLRTKWPEARIKIKEQLSTILSPVAA
ncbi:hypothetical protein C8N36_10316 [Pelagimonas varians]|uniref:Uncharacterized protein n=1 Tax=Pelagimonas varians TaxID=696760 RepID=A0A238KH82_9RHOB|nr:hypothetical protein C8N36_10316 [Pelagimonas varians]SMX42090.1 hypothetical protein PEV8663_02414 [Pelagimonas varians]